MLWGFQLLLAGQIDWRLQMEPGKACHCSNTFRYLSGVGGGPPVMNAPLNWVELWAHFDYERSLSGYVAAYPHRLEDGLLQHPSEKVRERVFGDQSRLDVILIDRNNMPVIVECKQGNPTLDHIAQLRHYMTKLQEETGQATRGILVHGGARKLAPEIATEAAKSGSRSL